jgi:hypothetical protein
MMADIALISQSNSDNRPPDVGDMRVVNPVMDFVVQDDNKVYDLDSTISSVPIDLKKADSVAEFSLKTIKDFPKSYEITLEGRSVFCTTIPTVDSSVPVVRNQAHEHYLKAFRKYIDSVGVPIENDRVRHPMFPNAVFSPSMGIDWEKLISFVPREQDRAIISSNLSRFTAYEDDVNDLGYLRGVVARAFMTPSQVLILNSWVESVPGFVLWNPSVFFSYFLRYMNSPTFVVTLRNEVISPARLTFLEGHVGVFDFLYDLPVIAPKLIKYSQGLVRDMVVVTSRSNDLINTELLEALNVSVTAYSEISNVPSKLSRIDTSESLLSFLLPAVTKTILSWMPPNVLRPRVDLIFSCYVTASLVPMFMMDKSTRQAIFEVLNKYIGMERLFQMGFIFPVAFIRDFEDADLRLGNHQLGNANVDGGARNIPDTVFGRSKMCYIIYNDATQAEPHNGEDYHLTTRNDACLLTIAQHEQSTLFRNLLILSSNDRILNRVGRAELRRGDAIKALANSVIESYEEFHHAMCIQTFNLEFIAANYFCNPFHNDGRDVEIFIPGDVMRGGNFGDPMDFDNMLPDRISRQFAPEQMTALCLTLVPNDNVRPNIDLSHILTPLMHSRSFIALLNDMAFSFHMRSVLGSTFSTKEIIAKSASAIPCEVYEKFVANDIHYCSRSFSALGIVVADIHREFTFKTAVSKNYDEPSKLDSLFHLSGLDVMIGFGSFHMFHRVGDVFVLLPGRKPPDEIEHYSFYDLQAIAGNERGHAQREAILSPYSTYSTTMVYSLKKLDSLEAYLSYDFSNPISFEGNGGAVVTVKDLVIPYCVLSAEEAGIQNRLTRVVQHYAPLWGDRLDYHFPSLDHVIGEVDQIQCLANAPEEAMFSEIFEVRKREL